MREASLLSVALKTVIGLSVINAVQKIVKSFLSSIVAKRLTIRYDAANYVNINNYHLHYYSLASPIYLKGSLNLTIHKVSML